MVGPNGKKPMLVGKTFFSIGLISIAFYMVFATPNYDKFWPETFGEAVFSFAPTFALVALPSGILTWLVGYVVFAISFLPEKGPE